MASIEKRITRDGKTSYRVKIRLKISFIHAAVFPTLAAQ